MKRDVLQVSIAAAILRHRFGCENGFEYKGDVFQNYTSSVRSAVMDEAGAVIDELVKLKVLKGVK